MEADKDRDGKISFEEFTKMVENTDVSMSMTLGKLEGWKRRTHYTIIKSTPFLTPLFCYRAIANLTNRSILSELERAGSSPASDLFGNDQPHRYSLSHRDWCHFG